MPPAPFCGVPAGEAPSPLQLRARALQEMGAAQESMPCISLSRSCSSNTTSAASIAHALGYTGKADVVAIDVTAVGAVNPCLCLSLRGYNIQGQRGDLTQALSARGSIPQVPVIAQPQPSLPVTQSAGKQQERWHS